MLAEVSGVLCPATVQFTGYDAQIREICQLLSGVALAEVSGVCCRATVQFPGYDAQIREICRVLSGLSGVGRRLLDLRVYAQIPEICRVLSGVAGCPLLQALAKLGLMGKLWEVPGRDEFDPLCEPGACKW